ncbi:hypothetical protein EA658_16720 [Pseudoxanthomonas winnipegensis]|uniref:Phage tail tape measure protein n=1 Tax=Pseudoxanthomonas winnipegensis TaxID=2480810 RepID=A0ABY1WCJ1_9GAMM|nr:phage tail length tape measure family protein [Pseudoxanthomonas winnipegensis]TAA11304.1 hypothetical protein EA659_08135 [Pseudoxanthomonas winnipegensis]TAA18727.1 hypothetical protein EA658_16720 [Pseudoxanthomonas winnipegensis]TAH73896.1 hypothetical protein EA657_00025 [Pseudoxanthomonas winnipegensis]
MSGGDIAQLGYHVDSSGLVEGARALDETAAAAEKAGAAADDLGSGFKKLSQDAQLVQRQSAAMRESTTQLRAAQIAAAAASEQQAIDLQKLLGQIDPTIAAFDRLDRQLDELSKARRLGLIDSGDFAHYQAMIESTRTSIGRFGQTAGQTAQAMRMLPAQITDITTGLLAGQSIWMVAIQQGGQLKDQFGGVGAAAKAVGGYVLGLVNPFTVTAAAIAGLAYAAYDSAKSLEELGIASAKGNGIAGTAEQLSSLADSLNGLKGVDLGNAERAVARLASGGRLAGENFTLAAEASARWASVTGESADDVASRFEAIARGPLQAIESGQVRVTQAQYDHVRALVSTGDQQGAVNELTRIFYSTINQNSDAAEAHLTGMTRLLHGMRDEFSELTRGVGSFFNGIAQGVVNATEKARKIRDQGGGFFASRAALFDWSSPPGASGSWAASDLYDPEKDKAQKARNEALAQWNATADKAAQRQVQLNRLQQQGVDLGQKQADIDRVKAQQLAEWAEQDRKAEARAARAAAPKQNTDDNSAQTFIASVQRQITANEQLAASGDKVSASDRLVIQAKQLLADKTNTMTAATRKLLEALIPTLQTTDAQAQAEVQRQRGLQATAQLTERLAQLEKQRQEQADIDLMGISRGADATQMLQRQLEIQRQYLQEREKLDKGQRDKDTALSQADYQNQQAMLEASLQASLATEAGYQQRRMALLGDWRTGFTRVWEDYVFAARDASDQAANFLSNSLRAGKDDFVRFVKTGKLSFSSLIDSMISDLARYAYQQAVVGIFGGGGTGGWSGMLASLFGASSSGSGAGASFGGGRAGGGDTRFGSFYQVGEGGKPELYQQNGKTYLIPGDSGRVIPAAAAPGGAGYGSPQINISVSGNAEVESATATPNNSGGFDVSVILKQIKAAVADDIASGTGSVTSALKGRYGLRPNV